EFTRYTVELMDNPEKLIQMKCKSRENAMSRSWDSVFETVYDAYHEAVMIAEKLTCTAHKKPRFES
ncbi:MAG: hypothetical protein ACT4O9_10630, partial [Blastocatellia bacterium]